MACAGATWIVQLPISVFTAIEGILFADDLLSGHLLSSPLLVLAGMLSCRYRLEGTGPPAILIDWNVATCKLNPQLRGTKLVHDLEMTTLAERSVQV